MKIKQFVLSVGLVVGGGLLWPQQLLAEAMEEPIRPIAPPSFTDEEVAQIALGRDLFHDPRLSRDNTTSCASCHSLETAGVDGVRVSQGVKGAMGELNAPTVINSSLNIAQFWDGRAASLEEQAAGPVHNPLEMDSNWDEVLQKLRRDDGYRQRFATLYEEGMKAETIQHAIAQFERSLLSVDAPFDRYLRGDMTAISDKAKRGYRLFKSYGCVACHQGQNVGGNMYARMGVMGNYFIRREKQHPSDLGRYNVTGDEGDRHVFKVPSLRLVTRTAPYFHDGGTPTLEEAIGIMARYQLGRSISPEETTLIIHFLETLAGEVDGGDS